MTKDQLQAVEEKVEAMCAVIQGIERSLLLLEVGWVLIAKDSQLTKEARTAIDRAKEELILAHGPLEKARTILKSI